MKKLTKEQHEAICEWLEENHLSSKILFLNRFKEQFTPACCNSCADGEECERPLVEAIEHGKRAGHKISIDNLNSL